MSILKLTYCSLIKIILSQIGGNPLQQLYSQLSQGKAQTAQGGLIPTGLSEIKQLIDQVTATINAAQAAVNDFSDVMEKIGGQLYQNPVGTSITAAIAAIDARITTVGAALEATPNDSTIAAQLAALVANKTALETFKTNTDRLSGVGAVGAASAGGCSLQDVIDYLKDRFVIFDVIELHRLNGNDLFQIDIIFQNKKSNIVKPIW